MITPEKIRGDFDQKVDMGDNFTMMIKSEIHVAKVS